MIDQLAYRQLCARYIALNSISRRTPEEDRSFEVVKKQLRVFHQEATVTENIDQLAYKDFYARFTFHLRRNCSEVTVRRALGIMAAGERRYGDCAFALNHEVFMAANFDELARDARAKAHLYDALAALQRETSE